MIASYNPLSHSLLMWVGFHRRLRCSFKVLSFTEEVTFCSRTKARTSLGWQKAGELSVSVRLHLDLTSLRVIFIPLSSKTLIPEEKWWMLMYAYLCWTGVAVTAGGWNDEWAAHFYRIHLPCWRVSRRNAGQSLITLPVCVSHLHTPDAYP